MSFSKFAFLFLLFVVVCFCLLRFFASLSNALGDHPEWDIESDGFYKPAVHAFALRVSNRPFLRGGFKTGTWGGFSSIATRKNYKADTVKVSAFIPKGGWLAVLCRLDENNAVGFVADRAEGMCSMVRVGADGGFLEKVSLGKFPVEKDILRFEFKPFGADGGKLAVNGVALPTARLGGEKISGIKDFGLVLKTGSAACRIFSVGCFAKGHRVFYSNFHRCGFRSAGIAAIVLLLSLVVCVFVFKNQNAYQWVFILLLGVLGAIFACRIVYDYAVDHWARKSSHYDTAFDFVAKRETRGRFAAVAGQRQRYTQLMDEGIILKAAEKQLEANRQKNCVLFMGSWAVWGEGSRKQGDGFVDVCARTLTQLEKDRKTDERGLVVVNAAVPGMNSSKVLDVFKDRFAKFRPRYCVVVLGAFFDPVPPVFYADLVALAKLAADSGTQLVFVAQGGAPEVFPGGVEHNRYMIRAAQDCGVPLIELHKAMLEADSSGFCWESPLCMSSYGHAVAGRFVGMELFEIFNDENVPEGRA